MQAAATNPPIDRLERRVSGFTATRGMGPWEHALRAPGPNISRDYGLSGGEQKQAIGAGEDVILCQGAAVGRCANGHTRHLRPYHAPQQFLGFVHRAIDPTKILLKSRGLVWLFVQGLAKAQIGSPVYVDDADSFSTEPGAHGVEMGRVVAFETDRPGWAIIGFKSHDDQRPYPGAELASRQR
jgi:hypothetical protein